MVQNHAETKGTGYGYENFEIKQIMLFFALTFFCSDCGGERIYSAHRGETGPGLEIPPLD
jgi:hypothetical protein